MFGKHDVTRMTAHNSLKNNQQSIDTTYSAYNGRYKEKYTHSYEKQLTVIV